jgi:tetratricopeptide (TPR) repeat protein
VNVKKIFLLPLVAAVVVSSARLGAESIVSETALYGEISSAYQSSSFPAVVEYVNQFEILYPRSLFLGQALSYKGESLFRLGRYEASVSAFDESLPLSKENNALQIATFYWKGRAQFAAASYTAALSSFNSCTTLYKNASADKKNELDKKTTSCNAHAFLYAGKSFYALGMYEKAVPLLEYTIARGEQYASSEYSEALLQLFTSYLNTKQYKRLTDVYEKLPDSSSLFIPEVLDECAFDAGQAYEAQGKYKKAYDCYSAVLLGTTPELASIALQRAYRVSSEHQAEVGQDSGAVLEKAKNTLAEYPELVSEFYVRLGIDAYTAGDEKKASSYFDKAEEHALPEHLAVIGLYRAEMTFHGKTKTAPQDTLAVLDSYAKKAVLVDSSKLYPSYEFTAVKCYAVEQNWAEVKVRAQRVLPQASYYYALASYETGDYAKAEELLSSLSAGGAEAAKAGGQREQQVQELYACTLAKLNKVDQATALFEKLDEAKDSTSLSESGRLNYAKLLLAQGFVNAAYRQSIMVNKPEAWYITALASFDRKDWQTAEQYFAKYLSSGEKENAAFAQFYDGYAQFRLGKTADAYKTLTSFTAAYPAHELAWNAHLCSANAAVSNRNYTAGIHEAEEAVRVSSTAAQKEQATLLSASIASDSGNYSKAIEVLAPYTSQSTGFGVRCRYQTAQIYAAQGKLAESDSLYGVVAEQFKTNELADDSAYRRGELYYSAGNYTTAVLRFDLYHTQFPAGAFRDAAYFYEGDSLTHLGQNDRAVLMYITLVNTLPKSSYCYSAKKNLIALYRTAGEYSDALQLAQSLVTDYGDQAKKDGIPAQVTELQKLAGGEDEQIVNQRAQYENNGGLATMEGRAAGTKLADMLWKNTSTQNEALALAEKLYPLQTTKQNEAKESASAVHTALIIAQSYRQSEKNKEAAAKYLSAAQYARMSKDDALASRALYGAVEAFDAAGMTADAKEAAATLAKLYPSSGFTQQAQTILNGK